MSSRYRKIFVFVFLFGVIPASVLIFPAIFSPRPNVVLHGVVRDDLGQPLPGVLVSGDIYYETNLIPVLWHSSPGLTKVETRTDKDGRFVLSGRGYDLRVYVQKVGYAHLNPRPTSEQLTFSYNRGTPPQDPNKPAVFILKKR
jgi:hypothetical protein